MAALVRNPTTPDPQPVRICDFTAWRLSFLHGAPLYEPYWSEAKRNAALPQMSKFLDQWGNAFRDRGRVAGNFAGPFSVARFRMAKPERVASRDDVTSGRAIFSPADTAADVRLAPLLVFPQPARWKTQTGFPIQTAGPKDPQTGKPTRVKSFDQAGSIWQAEEALIDGRWQRFYGFVGRHIIAEIPADEIEFAE